MKKILNVLGRNELGPFLLHAQGSQLRNLKGELQDFISKGGRSSKEIGKEKYSWLIAIKKRVGKKGLPEFLNRNSLK
jgi:hypothetical protein